jgi:excisionase family DNA binding protein
MEQKAKYERTRRPQGKDMPNQASRFLDNQTAANYLNLSPRTLEKWLVQGGGPIFRKFGRRVLYAIEDLDAYANANRRSNTSHNPA